eukprot:4246110-Alexandrium_andersonii.AAC.1
MHVLSHAGVLPRCVIHACLLAQRRFRQSLDERACNIVSILCISSRTDVRVQSPRMPRTCSNIARRVSGSAGVALQGQS